MNLKQLLDDKLRKFKPTQKAKALPLSYEELKAWRESLNSSGGGSGDPFTMFETKTFEKMWTMTELTALNQQARLLPTGANNWAIAEIIPGVPGKIISVLTMDGTLMGGTTVGSVTNAAGILYATGLGQTGIPNAGQVTNYYGNLFNANQDIYVSGIETKSNEYIDDVSWGDMVGRGIWHGSFSQPLDMSATVWTVDGFYYVRGTYIEITPNWL